MYYICCDRTARTGYQTARSEAGERNDENDDITDAADADREVTVVDTVDADRRAQILRYGLAADQFTMELIDLSSYGKVAPINLAHGSQYMFPQHILEKDSVYLLHSCYIDILEVILVPVAASAKVCRHLYGRGGWRFGMAIGVDRTAQCLFLSAVHSMSTLLRPDTQ
jgi:hypothetical protein